MSFEVEYTANARRELEDTYLWIKLRAPISAVRWREDLITKVESLSNDPHRHRLAPESKKFPCVTGNSTEIGNRSWGLMRFEHHPKTRWKQSIVGGVLGSSRCTQFRFLFVRVAASAH